MFSTEILVLVIRETSRTPATKLRAYLRCHRNGGWATTTSAPTWCVSLAAIWILVHALPHTCCVNSSVGAWIVEMGSWYFWMLSSSWWVSWLMRSWVTSTSTLS